MRVIHLFYATALTASAIQLFGMFGLLLASGIAASWLYVFRACDDEMERLRMSHFSIALFLLLIFVGVLPSVNVPRVTRRIVCANNLKQICLALHNYAAVYGRFPPAITYDGNGQPLHSWRVLLLPYLDETKLYKAYSLTEPWDGPNNRKLLSLMPSVFRCPYQNIRSTATGYCVVVGERTCFPPSSGRQLREIVDGESNTIAIVESSSKTPWMAPLDPTLEQFTQEAASWGVKNPPPHYHHDLFTHYSHGANSGMADASTQITSGHPNPSVWKKFLQVDDGLPSDQESAEFSDGAHLSYTRARPEGYFLIATFGLLAVLPAFWLGKRKNVEENDC